LILRDENICYSKAYAIESPVASRAVCVEETLVPHVQGPDENEDADEIRPEDSAHDRDYLDLIYDITLPGSGPYFRTGPGGVEDIES
jgi:hypothetical protein